MEFIVNNGPFMKSKNTKDKILLINFIMLIPFLVYRLFLNSLNSIIIFVISLISSIVTSFLYNYINNKKQKFNNYYKELIYSIIITLITPVNVSYLLLFFVSVVVIFLSKYFDMFNIYLVSATIIYLTMILTSNTLQFVDYNIYIFSILILISLITLINTRSIKFRITLFCLLVVIIKLLLNQSVSGVDYLLLFSSIFVIPEFKSTPNPAFIQIVFGLLSGILSIFFNIEILFIIILILNIVFKYIDKNYAYYLAK